MRRGVLRCPLLPGLPTATLIFLACSCATKLPPVVDTSIEELACVDTVSEQVGRGDGSDSHDTGMTARQELVVEGTFEKAILGRFYLVTAVTLRTDEDDPRGLNLDEDLDTCSPAPDCADGIDNGLVAVPELVSLMKESGNFLETALLNSFPVPAVAFVQSAESQGVDVIGLQVAPIGAACGHQPMDCAYRVCEESFDPVSLKLKTEFPGLKILGDSFLAGDTYGSGQFELCLGEPCMPDSYGLTYCEFQCSFGWNAGTIQLHDCLFGGAVSFVHLAQVPGILMDPSLASVADVLRESLGTTLEPDLPVPSGGNHQLVSLAFSVSLQEIDVPEGLEPAPCDER
jgi:hypothetical protein